MCLNVCTFEIEKLSYEILRAICMLRRILEIPRPRLRNDCSITSLSQEPIKIPNSIAINSCET